MKESIGEKILDIVRMMVSDGQVSQEVAEKYFPELKESKDERIRKALIKFHKSTIDIDGIKGEQIVAWLERRGNNMGISEATKQELEDNLNKALEKETPESLGEFLDGQGEQKETLCDKCRKEQPSHSCQDITELGRCAVEHEQKPADKDYENESLAALIEKVDWLDVLNNKNSKVRRRGYAKTFSRVCASRDINTIKDLLKVGSYRLKDARNMGAAILAIVSEALYSLYGIDKW